MNNTDFPPKPKRGQANRRERVRTENVNAGFDNLRRLIPTDPEDRKLSKIEILRLATSYINHLYNLTKANSCLEALLSEEQDSSSSTTKEGDDTEDSSDSEPGLGPCGDQSPNLKTKDTLRSKRRLNPDKSSRLKHVCTFCLMMTKMTPNLTNKKR